MRFSLCTPPIKSSKFLIYPHTPTPRTKCTSGTSPGSPKADERRKHCADAAKEAEREADEGSVEAQRADREEVVEEEERVPEDESLPPRGGATCPHPHRGGGQIENIVFSIKIQIV